ncbi:MAG: NAD-dependent succinate-semialdehyde dehydrogenase [Chloroflexota bacterium]|nr:NAD-dependent succinate-semialdehyde dehydrogenase [Chloroflexota bacterium]
MTITSINPATGEKIEQYQEMTQDEVQSAIELSHQAFLGWRETSYEERANLMCEAASLLLKGCQCYSALMAQEMGKPIKEGVAEVEKCAWVCSYYADNAERFLQPEMVETDASRSFVTFQPLGVILAVMPWNFPFWQVFRFCAPALMAGNSVVLKHASNVPGCALSIEDIMHIAGFPTNLFRTLLIGSNGVGDVIQNDFIKAVTLTGSATAGRAVAKKAGEMLKKTVLELGGSDAYIVLEDADLDLAVDACVTSKLINCGQVCIAPKRFIVVNSQRDRFEQLMVERMSDQKVGDPFEETTILGPLARHDLRDQLHCQVEESTKRGARRLLGGEIPKGRGAFYPATVLTDVSRGMPAYDEELFGPVAAIVPVKDEDEAIAVANDSAFGLGAAVFTQDIARGERIAANHIEAGCCFVNTFVKSDPRLPFGGIKESGYGRELSHYGIKEFVNIKTVYIK